MDPKLFNAAFIGDVNALLELIQEDALILRSVTVTTSNTPLHMAALLGHTHFATVVMQYEPELADELNQQGLTPIHLASAKGNWEIVREMLVRRPDLAVIKDEGGKIPLHTAAIRGRVQVLRELFSIESAQELTPSGETALHVAVKNNQYQAVENLIQLANQYQVGNKLFNSKDEDGNTILHLACAGKKSKIVKLLVSETTVEVNAINSEGLSALDIAVRMSTEGASNNEKEIQQVLRSAGAELSGRADEQPVVSNRQQEELARSADSRPSSNKNSIDSLRNGIGVVSVLFATLSFQLVMTPPGGAWQDWPPSDTNNSPAPAGAAGKVTHNPGISIIWELQRSEFLSFLSWNAILFFNSLMILTLLAFSEVFDYSHRENWNYLVHSLFGSVLVAAAAVFVKGMALVTHTSPGYISSNICRSAWITIVVLMTIAFFIFSKGKRIEETGSREARND